MEGTSQVCAKMVVKRIQVDETKEGRSLWSYEGSSVYGSLMFILGYIKFNIQMS